MKALVTGEESLPVTRVVQAIFEGKSHPVADTFVTLDPKLRSGDAGAAAGAGAGGAGDSGHTFGLVFMIGGGNYKEYHNLQDYSKVALRICLLFEADEAVSLLLV